MSNTVDNRDQRIQPHEHRETPRHDNRFEGRQRTNSHEPRYPSYPAPRGRERENRSNLQSEQFKGDYEQFDHTPARQPRDSRRQEEHPPQIQSKRIGKTPEVERHVTPLPDGRVLKGPRPIQRKNAQFWTDISQDTEQLVNQVQIPDEPADEPAEKTAEKTADEQAQTSAVPLQQSAPPTRASSSRAKAAKRAASAARKGHTDRPVSSGPKPSQRGFKWPSPPSQQ
jgi:hypothetical protein